MYSQKLIKFPEGALYSGAEFKWLSQAHGPISLYAMHTNHLFYTFRMIYNHMVPEHMRVDKHRRHVFDRRIYTKEYIKEAFVKIYHELLRREDLSERKRRTIAVILTRLMESKVWTTVNSELTTVASKPS